MKVKFGAIVVDGRNKIGGHVASKNHYGSYFRTKVTPSNPSTPAQSAARNRTITIAAAWKMLDAASVSLWSNVLPQWTKSDCFGDVHAMTAISLYHMLNNNILRAGGSRVDVPPVRVSLSDLGIVSVAAVDNTSLTITCALQALEANEVLEVFATPLIPPGKRFVKSEYRLITSQAALTAGVYVASTAYTAKYGSVNFDNGRIYVKVRIINEVTGQVSVPVAAFCEDVPE